eukprot:459989_1
MSEKVELIVHTCDNLTTGTKVTIDFNSSFDGIMDKITSASELPISKNQYKLYAESGKEIKSLAELYKLSNNDSIFVFDDVNSKIKYASEESTTNITILGVDKCGKSSLIYKYLDASYDIESTKELTESIDYYRREIVAIDGYDVYITINKPHVTDYNKWKIRDEYFVADGFCLVLDVCNEHSLNKLDIIYNYLCNTYIDQKLPPVIIIGNKCDIISTDQIKQIINYFIRIYGNHFDAHRIPNDILQIICDYYEKSMRNVSYTKAQALASKWNVIKYIETSAKNGNNVENAFGCLLRNILVNKSIKQNNYKKKNTCVCV